MRQKYIFEKYQNIISKSLTFFTILCLLIFFSSFGFKDSKTGGWYQQWFPNLNGSTIASMTFLDSLTGYAVTNSNSLLQEYILKTSNGGDNWFINYTFNTPNSNWSFIKVSFLNSNTGFAFSWTEMFKTTDGGNNWNMITYSLYPQDVAVINKDTMLAVQSSGFDGGVYRTTNGGLNWQPLGPTGGSGQPYSIYMFNKDFGFCLGGQMRRTTNGGVNWFAITGETYSSIQMVDSMVGWKSYAGIKKTTNGGLNWVSQQIPNLPHSWVTSYNFALNKDTIWLVGDESIYAPLYKTTNGGLNWGYQFADTSIHISVYNYISYVTRKIGWASSRYYYSEIHTVVGGNDTTYFTSIHEPIVNIASDFVLYQNYPNPFNPKSNIKYKIEKTTFTKIIVFDITGKEIATLVNKKQNAGTYEIQFDGSNLSSGIYFYTLFVDGIRIDTKKAILIK
jgi:photosystem II stability/assembly factor-like uncharacterized protein